MSDYTPTEWKDKKVQYPKRYDLTLVSGTTYEIDGKGVQGTVTEAGTNINASALNNIEEGNEYANNAKYSNDNLLPNSVAGCESTDGWSTNGITLATDDENRFELNNCLKLTKTTATQLVRYDIFSLLTAEKYYLLSMYIKNGDYSGGIALQFNSDDTNVTSSYSTSTSWTRVGIIIKPSDFDNATVAYFRPLVDGSVSEFGYIDAIAVQEITASEYAEGVTTLLTKYPFSRQSGIDTTAEVISLPDSAVTGELVSVVNGRTVANLLEDDVAGCEDNSNFTASSAVLADDSSNELEGTNCMKITTSGSATGSAYVDVLSKLDTTKYYLFSAHVKNSTGTNGIRLSANCVGDAGLINASYSTTTNYIRQGVVLKPADFDGASAVQLRIYVSGAIGEIGFVDAIQINEISAYEYSLGADALLDDYPFHRGLGSVESCRIKSVGKNLLGQVLFLDSSGGTASTTVVVASDSGRSYIEKVNPSTEYTVSRQTAGTRFRYFYYNQYPVIGSTLSTGGGYADSSTEDTFTTDSDTQYVFVVVSDSSENVDAQLELGDTATAHEPHKQSIAYSPTVLRGVPNGKSDSWYANDGKVVKRVEEHNLLSGDIDAYTAGVNVDYVQIGLDAFTNLKTQDAGIVDGSLKINFGTGSEVGNDSIDQTKYEYWFRTTSANLFLIVPSGTYTDVADARAALTSTVTTKIVYELDPDSYTTTYYPSNAVTAYKDGTVYNELVTQDKGFYDSGISITNTDLLISSLDYVERINLTTGVITKVDISDITIDGDKLGFTDSGGTDGDYYRYAYYPLFGCTRSKLSYSFPKTAKAESDSLADQIVALDKKVETYNQGPDLGRWEFVSSTTLTADSAQVDISIPADAEEVLLIGTNLQASSTTDRSLLVRFNSDSGANYDQVLGGVNNLTLNTCLIDNSGSFVGYVELMFTNSSSFYKRAFINSASGASGVAQNNFGGWRSTNVVNTINLIPSADNINEDSTFILYIRRANQI